jgi:hypothetical protein
VVFDQIVHTLLIVKGSSFYWLEKRILRHIDVFFPIVFTLVFLNMTIAREKRSILMENEGSDKYESDESTAVTTRRRRSGLNYLSWVTDHNSEGKTTMDIIVDWLKIKENYTKVMEDLAFDNKAAAMRNYDGIVKKLVETEHVSRKPEAVRQHCIELQNKFYSVLDEFDGQGYAFTEKKDNEVRVLDKNKRKKRLSGMRIFLKHAGF